MNPGRGWLGIGISTDGLASPIAIHGSLSSSPPAVGHKEGTTAAALRVRRNARLRWLRAQVALRATKFCAIAAGFVRGVQPALYG
jgi:hypothetical protein